MSNDPKIEERPQGDGSSDARYQDDGGGSGGDARCDV